MNEEWKRKKEEEEEKEKGPGSVACLAFVAGLSSEVPVGYLFTKFN